MKLYSFSLEEITQICNIIKDLLIDRLISDKILIDKKAEDLKAEYIAMAFKKGMLGKYIDNILFKDEKKCNEELINYTISKLKLRD